MKKCLKICLLLFILFLFHSFNNHVEANSIDKISMDIFVDDSGTAHVTEIWECYTDKGTEVYHPYYNLGNSEIYNFSVSENNSTYSLSSNWDTSGDLKSKAYKCGINYISDGLELCWGISKYGNHTYNVSYNISNFVSELNDSQMIYWTLIPYEFSNSIGHVYIKIHTNFNIEDTIPVWGYGNTGTCYVYNGCIEMQSDGTLPTTDYMTILAKFPLNTFNLTNKLDYDFDYYYEMAEEGAIPNTNYTYSDSDNILDRIFLTIIMIPFNLLFIFTIPAAICATPKFNYEPDGKNISKDIDYFRDIPCKKDIYRAYYIGHKYGIIKNVTDILGAIILKWIKDDLIKVEQKDGGTIFKKENTVIILTETDLSKILDEKEHDLFNMLYTASKDGILENKEFEKWCSKSYSKILSWFDKILDREEKKLIEEGLIIISEKRYFKFFKRKIYTFTSDLKDEAIELAGLKKYLNDYTLIKERESIEVKLFEEYLIYAQMMGIAKKVAKEFKDLYPEIIQESHYTSYDNILFIHMYTSAGISSATSAKSRAESYSSGGGGFSSSGGGGGSFGGGGGRRRLPLK